LSGTCIIVDFMSLLQAASAARLAKMF
jgi:hypothetical protein